MKYLKSFTESDSWMGSLYAYNNPIPPKNGNDGFEYPYKKVFSFKCNNCNTEFDTFGSEDGEINCVACDSTDVEKYLGDN